LLKSTFNISKIAGMLLFAVLDSLLRGSTVGYPSDILASC